MKKKLKVFKSSQLRIREWEKAELLFKKKRRMVIVIASLCIFFFICIIWKYFSADGLKYPTGFPPISKHNWKGPILILGYFLPIACIIGFIIGHYAVRLEGLKSLRKIRLEFWEMLLERINQSGTKHFQNIRPSDYNRTTGIEVGGLDLSFVITKHFCSVELFVSPYVTEFNKWILLEYLRKEQIKSDFLEKFLSYDWKDSTWNSIKYKFVDLSYNWEDSDSTRISIKFKFDDLSYYNREEWDTMMTLMMKGMIILEKAMTWALKIQDQKKGNQD